MWFLYNKGITYRSTKHRISSHFVILQSKGCMFHIVKWLI